MGDKLPPMSNSAPTSIYTLLAEICQIVKEHEQSLRDLQPDDVRHEIGQSAGYERRLRALDEVLEKLREV